VNVGGVFVVLYCKPLPVPNVINNSARMWLLLWAASPFPGDLTHRGNPWSGTKCRERCCVYATALACGKHGCPYGSRSATGITAGVAATGVTRSAAVKIVTSAYPNPNGEAGLAMG
jgi:hypothetical protein